MRKHILMILLAGCAVIAAGCGNSQKKETEAQKPVETAAARETEAPAAETEAAVAETEAAVVETEAAVAETEAAVVETEAAVVETEAAVAETEAKVVETEAETEAKVVETEAETEAKAVETEAETEAKVVETEAETEAKVVETEAETEAKVVETEAETEAKAAETEAETEAETVETGFETEEDFDDYDETETEAEAIPKPVFDISDYLVIKDDEYMNLSVQVPAAEKVTDEEVNEEIESAFSYLENYDDLIIKKTEGKVKTGDTVNIDYVGTKDGEEFDGGSAEGYDLVIGSGTFIDGFEDGLVGKEIGSEVDLDLTFPEEYGVEELNGADVVFHVTLNYVSELPELTDEIAKELSGGEYDNVDDYVESVRSSLQSDYDEEYRDNAYTQIMGKLAEIYSLDEFPEENVEYYIDTIMAQYIEPYAAMYGMSVEDFISAAYGGLTEEEFREQELIPAAESNLKQEIILSAIGEKEGITMTDEELDKLLQGYADEYGMTVEELIAGTDREAVRSSELQRKVMEWLYENVDIEAVSETEAEVTAETEAETAAAETEAETAAETEAETEMKKK